MRRITTTTQAKFEELMFKLHAVHAPVVVIPEGGDTRHVFYEPSSEFRLEEFGETYDANGNLTNQQY